VGHNPSLMRLEMECKWRVVFAARLRLGIHCWVTIYHFAGDCRCQSCLFIWALARGPRGVIESKTGET
jgi:hypothetical protein